MVDSGGNEQPTYVPLIYVLHIRVRNYMHEEIQARAFTRTHNIVSNIPIGRNPNYADFLVEKKRRKKRSKKEKKNKKEM